MILDNKIVFIVNDINEYGEQEGQEEFIIRCKVIFYSALKYTENNVSEYSNYDLVIDVNYRNIAGFLRRWEKNNITARFMDRTYNISNVEFRSINAYKPKYAEISFTEIHYEV